MSESSQGILFAGEAWKGIVQGAFRVLAFPWLYLLNGRFLLSLVANGLTWALLVVVLIQLRFPRTAERS